MTWVGITGLVGSQAVVVVVLRLVHTRVPVEIRKRNNEVVGVVFATVATLYTVLTAFVVVVVWERIGDAREVTFQEANALGGVYWTARQLPVEGGGPLERFTLDYAHVVIDQEWALMAEGKSSPAATQLVYQMRERSYAFNLDGRDGRQLVNFEKLTDHVAELASARRQRLNAIQDAVPGVLWISLIGGAVVTVSFMFFLGMESNVVHHAVTLMLTAMITLSLILIAEMSYPFDGIGRVPPNAFEVFLSRLPPPR
jgi:hypothetical protein